MIAPPTFIAFVNDSVQRISDKMDDINEYDLLARSEKEDFSVCKLFSMKSNLTFILFHKLPMNPLREMEWGVSIPYIWAAEHTDSTDFLNVEMIALKKGLFPTSADFKQNGLVRPVF